MKQKQSTKLVLIRSLQFSIQEPIGLMMDQLHRLNFDLRLVSSTSVIARIHLYGISMCPPPTKNLFCHHHEVVLYLRLIRS